MDIGSRSGRPVTRRMLLDPLTVAAAMSLTTYAQVFLPYVQESEGGRTIWDAFKEQRFKQIEAPKQ
jgi:hypothetical protein